MLDLVRFFQPQSPYAYQGQPLQGQDELAQADYARPAMCGVAMAHAFPALPNHVCMRGSLRTWVDTTA